MRKFNNLLYVALTSALLFAGCASSSRQVSRINPDSKTDLSGSWNDTDSRLTAEEMVNDVIKRNWITDYIEVSGKKPVVIVGTIRNRSSEHIATDVFIKDIERELINSGKINFVASKDERDEVRDEKNDQQQNASDESMKKLCKEKGADFMLSGEINSIEDSVDGQKVVFYQIDLQMINIETNQKVWLGNKKIKKLIGQDRYKF
jgi:uncharacterized protein (TIGR02722 family)